MNNPFLDANLTRIERLKTHLLELEMLSEYQEIPIAQIRHLFDGLVLEVSRLQGVADELVKLLPKKKDEKSDKEKGKEASGK